MCVHLRMCAWREPGEGAVALAYSTGLISSSSYSGLTLSNALLLLTQESWG